MPSHFLSSILSSGSKTFFGTALSVWMLVCVRIIFKKAGRKGWEAIIPVWNVYILFKIIGKTGRFWIVLFGLPLVSILWLASSLIFHKLGQQGGEGLITMQSTINRILGIAGFIFGIVTVILIIMTRCRLAKKFGKSSKFAVGLIFLTPIFFGILAFNDAKYEGIEFNGRYNWKKWLFITLGIALVIGCCKAGLEYKHYKDFLYNYELETGEKNGEFRDITWDGKEYGGKYENGKKVGHWVEYNYGEKWEGYYNEEGERNGEREMTTEDGKLGGGRYENGKKVGHWIGYVASIKSDGNYNNEGLEEGEWKFYYDNGNLSRIGNYKNGKHEGEWKFYYDNGNLSKIGNFKNGKQEGERTYYREDGTSTKLLFKDGNPWEGTEITAGGHENYYKDGGQLIPGK